MIVRRGRAPGSDRSGHRIEGPGEALGDQLSPQGRCHLTASLPALPEIGEKAVDLAMAQGPGRPPWKGTSLEIAADRFAGHPEPMSNLEKGLPLLV
jgi:hypothetical protein